MQNDIGHMPDDSPDRLAVLGYFSLTLDSDQFTHFSYDKVKALLLYLLLHDKPISRSALAELLWPEQGTSSGRTNLRHALHSLRQSLGEHAAQLLTISRHEIGFVLPADVSFDLHELQDLLAQPPDSDALEAVLHCYRGDVVEELKLSTSSEYQRWLMKIRNEWRHRVIHFAEQVLNAQSNMPVSDHLLISLVGRFSGYGPFHERLVRQLAESGQLAAAHEQHSSYLQLLSLAGQQPPTSFLQLAGYWSNVTPQINQAHDDMGFCRSLAVGSAPLSKGEIEQRQLSVMAIRLTLNADLSTRSAARAVLSLQMELMRWVEEQCQHLGGFWLSGATGGVGLACFGTDGPAHQLAELVALYEHCRMHLPGECQRHWRLDSAPPQVAISAGLNSGRVLYLPERNMVDPLGQVTQESLALMNAAQGCELVISHQASEHMPPALDLQPRLSSRQVWSDGSVQLRALVLTPGSGETARPSLIGREVALRTLRDAHARATIGLRQSALVRGPSGIGKSALLVGFRQQEQNDLTAICWQPMTRLSSLEPYAVARKMLRWYLGGPVCAQAVAELMEWPGGDAEQSAGGSEDAPCRLLHEALGLREPQEPAASQTSESLAQVVELMYRVVTRVTAKHTLVLMIDDLQWLDEPSFKVLTGLQARLAINSPFLLVASHHGREMLPVRMDWDQQVTLERLDDRQSLRLLTHLARHYQLTLSPLLKQQIIERCDGVPLYYQEICRRLDTEYQEGRSISLEDIPKGMLGLLGARIDQLGNDRYVAQVAAVLGRRFRLDFLAECCGVADADLTAALELMVHLEIIQPADKGRQVREMREYQFTHQLLQEAAYLSCPRDIRTALHSQFVELIEQRFPMWISRRPGEFASHLQHSGQYARGARYFELTAREAMKVSANRTALHMADAGLASLRHVEGQAEREISLHNVRGQAAYALEGHGSPTAHESFIHARKLLKQETVDTPMDIGDCEQAFLVNWGLWLGCSQRNAHHEAYQLAENLTDLAGQLSDERYQRLADFAGARCDYWSGRIAQAGQQLDRLDPVNSAMMINSLSYSEHPQVAASCYHAWTLCLRGDYRRAVLQIEAAIRLAEDINHPGSLAMALLYAAAQYRQLGYVQLAVQRVERACQLADSPDLQLWHVVTRIVKGWQAALAGDPAGLEQIDVAQGELTEITGRDQYQYPLLKRVDALLALGELKCGEAYLDRCLVQAQTCLPLFVPELAIQLARVRQRLGHGDTEIYRLLKLAIGQARTDGNLHQLLCGLEAWLTLIDLNDGKIRDEFRRALGETSYSDAPILVRWRTLLDRIEPHSAVQTESSE